MKHLEYSHTLNQSLAETCGRWINGMLPKRLRSPKVADTSVATRSRFLVLIGWLITLAVQAALVLLVSELVSVVHGVMSLYLDLADMQLDLTSQYVSATSPK
jgi:hypothetical protein